MRKFLFSSPRVLILGVLFAAFSAAPAYAATTTRDTEGCAERSFSQAFVSYKDNHWYAPVAGQSEGGFDGAGWTLSGGAKIVTTTLPGGVTGTALDLPSGAKATTPVECVTNEYPTARAFVKNVKGAEGVAFEVEYEGTPTWGKPKNTGQIHGANGAWEPATPVNLQPEGHFSGWQPMRIVLTGKGTTSEFQVYDLQLDPRLSH
jgi:hypothetical protein